MALPRPSTRLLDLLRSGVRTVVLTGAGVSAESGLATFRGPEGLWEGHDPVELATPEAFAADSRMVWRFYEWRRRQAAAARPNPAHQALAALERHLDEFLLVTQNVDGLHESAGSERIVRLHGSLWRLRCTADGTERDDRNVEIGDPLPRCDCGALLRPGVVWFGEGLPAAALDQAVAAARNAQLILVCGTSSVVYPAAELPRIGRASGAYVVEINPERTALSDDLDERLAGPAGEVLPDLLRTAEIEVGTT